MKWLFFGIGVIVGGMVGIVVMCLCVVSGRESRREEQRERDEC